VYVKAGAWLEVEIGAVEIITDHHRRQHPLRPALLTCQSPLSTEH